MRKIYLLFIVLALFFYKTDLYSQDYVIKNSSIDRLYSKEEVEKLNKRICVLMKEKKYQSEDNYIVLHHISKYSLLSRKWGISGRYCKDDFLDGSFLSRIIPQIINNRIEIDGEIYIGSTVLVENVNGEYLGKGDAKYFYLATRYNPEFFAFLRFVLEKKKELTITQLFTLDSFIFYPIFGITGDNNIVVFIPDHPDKKKKIVTLQEFVDLYSQKYEELFLE